MLQSALACALILAPRDEQVFELDPVELVAGREVHGQEAISLKRGLFMYRFVSEQNRDKFRSEPERFEIQLGGGCGRMGPLSGIGQTSIFAVHDERIYIFASKQCRAGFLKAPEKLIDRPDPQPSPTDESRARALAMLDRAAARAGHPEKFRSRPLTLTRTRKVISGDREYENLNRITVGFPNRFRRDVMWDSDRWSYVTTGQKGWIEKPGNVREMANVQARAHRRRFLSHPLVVLSNRNRKDFVAEILPPIEVEGRRLRRVRVWLTGVATVLGIDEADDIVSATVRDRGQSLAFVQVERRYDGYEDIEGLRVATSEHVLNDGKPTSKEPLRWTAAAAPEGSTRAFVRPQSANE